MKKCLPLLILFSMLFVSGVIAEPLSVGGNDTIISILNAHKDKRVTVKLKSGNELTGKVGAVNEDIVHLNELSGMEYFDAVTSIKAIEAVVIRTKG